MKKDLHRLNFSDTDIKMQIHYALSYGITHNQSNSRPPQEVLHTSRILDWSPHYLTFCKPITATAHTLKIKLKMG